MGLPKSCSTCMLHGLHGLKMGLQFSLIQQCNVTRAQLNATQCHTGSIQCNVTPVRAQRAPRAHQKAAGHACFTGSTSSKRILTTFIDISHYICHNFGYTWRFWLKFRLIAAAWCCATGFGHIPARPCVARAPQLDNNNNNLQAFQLIVLARYLPGVPNP